MPQNSQKPPQISIGVIIYIWGVLLFSQFIYLALAFQKNAGTHGAVTEVSYSDTLEILTILLSLAAIGLAWKIPPYVVRILGARKYSRSSGNVAPRDDVTMSVPGFVVQMALLELVTVFGLIRAIQIHDGTRILPYFAVTLIGMLWSYPTKLKARSLVKRALT